jgi:rhodanese-related sulfurtransferase
MSLFARTDGIDPATAARHATDDGTCILDVRELDEWEAGRIPGAVHIPLGELPARTSELPTDQPIIVVCRSGGRSAMATAHLVGLGVDAVNLEGGTQAWHAQGLPLDPADGHVA